MTDVSRDDLFDALDAFADDLLADWGVAAPPVDLPTIAVRDFGVTFAVADGRPKRGTRSDPRAVALPYGASPRDRAWAAAHALGRILKPTFLERNDLERGLTGESVAGLIAERLLVPTAWFRDACRACDNELPSLAATFANAPEDVLAERMCDLDDRVVVTVIDNDFVARRRSRGVRVSRTMSDIEARCAEQVRRYSRPCSLSGDGRSVRGWPFHREDHKREILRTVVDEFSE